MTTDNSGHIPPNPALHHHPGQASHTAASDRRRPYTTPRLEVYGDIQALTLGGSPGMGESGATNRNPLGVKRKPQPPAPHLRRPTDPNRR